MIRFVNYSWQYEGAPTPVLNDLHLDIAPGTCVLLSGASGSGKSTFGLALTCLLQGRLRGQVSGYLHINGVDVTNATPAAVAGTVALVQQNPELNFATHVVEQELAFGLENFCWPQEAIRARVDRVLGDFNIEKLRHRSLRDLSEGQKQRVAIAAACVIDPKVLFLDEPTSSLDPDGLYDLLTLLQELVVQQALTLVIAEHRMDVFLSLVDRHLHLVNGHLLPAPPMPAPLSQLVELTDRTTSVSIRVSVQDLVVRRGDSLALNGVSLDLRAGEVTALMGPNGSGKSSLLLALLGLIPAFAGNMTVNGRTVQGRATYDLSKQVGLVFQNPDHQLFAETVREEALLAAQNFDCATVAIPQVDRYLSQAGLEACRDRHPYRLSFGQKRRLNVIASILHGIRVLLLDEPFVGQDVGYSRWLIQTVAQLRRQGVTVVMVLHDPQQVLACCDRVVFLDQGKVRVDDGVEEAWMALQSQGFEVYTPFGRGASHD